MVNEKFGRLTIIAATSNRTQKREIVYLCQCDCGNVTTSPINRMRSGGKLSCGCLKQELDSIKGKLFKKDNFPSSFNRVYRTYKRHAQSRGLSFDLTKQEFLDLSQKNCYYCNIGPSNISKEKGLDNSFIYNGIDRKDNNQGYHISNSVPCCYKCNRAKMAMSESDFYEWIKMISENLKNKGII